MTVENNQELKTAGRKKLNRKIDAAGWGVFFIWIGVAILADAGWGVGLIGVGVIILGGMAAREYFSDESGSRPTNENCFTEMRNQ
jgi:hypothetical protein